MFSMFVWQIVLAYLCACTQTQTQTTLESDRPDFKFFYIAFVAFGKLLVFLYSNSLSTREINNIFKELKIQKEIMIVRYEYIEDVKTAFCLFF
jgi:hypothetical protein